MPKKKDFADRSEIKMEAIPAARLVKEEILSVRTACIRALSELVYRQRRKQEYDKELGMFQANVITLYQLLRQKFRKKKTKKRPRDKIMALDEVIVKDIGLDLKTLYEYFCILQKKIEDLKITKIERPQVDPKKSMG